MGKRILVVDDNPEIINICRRALVSDGYQVLAAHDGTEALQVATREEPDLAIIDIVMPGVDGVQLCQSLRALRGLDTIPVLFLTGKSDITDKAAAYAVGADDYLTKPFDIRELLMRVRALLRRAAMVSTVSARPAELIVGDLRLDCRSFSLSTPEKTVPLTPVEFDLMYYMMSKPGKVHTSESLLAAVWGYPEGSGSTDVVRAHIKNIRDKIEPNRAEARYIRTVGRHGYCVGS